MAAYLHLQQFWRAYLLNLLFLTLLLATHSLAYSDELRSGTDPGGGEFRLRDSSGQRYAELLGTDVQIEVEGMLARVILRQHFHNPSSEWAEGEYLFPLPTDSAVDYMAMEIGERRIVGKIREREEARQRYEAAKNAGKKASLLLQQRPNLFTSRVANIAPGESIQVELHYLQSLHYDQGRFSLRVPTTLTPRYIPGRILTPREQTTDGRPLRIEGSGWALPTDRVPDAPAITPPMVPSQAAAPLRLQASIRAGFTLAELKSLHHPAEIESRSDHHMLRLKPGAGLDRDVVLEWSPKVGEAPLAAALHQHLDGSDYLLLMVLPPQEVGNNRLPRETIFVIDSSGSMAGTSIDQARRALLHGLDQLRAGDRFNIVEFNSRTRPLWRDAQPASAERLAEARGFVAALTADGGTEMRPALEFALQQPFDSQPQESQQRERTRMVQQVIFITDGSVGNEAELFELIKQRRGDSRVFTVGIGSAPNSYFMRNAAEAGQGSFTYIGSADEVETRMLDLFHKLSNPVMTNLRLDFGGKTGEAFPARLPDLYAGEPLIMSARFSDGLPPVVTLDGERSGKHFQQRLLMPLAAQTDERRHISTLWARSKLHQLYDVERRSTGEEAGQLRGQITALALQHQLMSRYTAFLAVDENPSRPADASLHKEVIPNSMPAGNAMALPSGALGLRAYWLTALLAALGLLLLYSGRRPRWLA